MKGTKRASVLLGSTFCLWTVYRLSGGTLDDPAPNANLVGPIAPPFTVTTLDGRQISLTDYKGNALILSFWATWCGNCKLEMPWLTQLRDRYAGQGFESAS
jgi:thiol-disulfide isomerase/thioredoxin